MVLLSCGGLAWTECPSSSQSDPVAPAPASAPGAVKPPPGPVGPATLEAPAPAASGPIACKVDADCPVLACGPCTPGTVITRERMNGPDCARNPCKNAASSCTDQVCVVHANTERDPGLDVAPPPPT